MRRHLTIPAALLGLLVVAMPARAQDPVAGNFAIRYDLDSTTLIYPRVIGQGSPFSGPSAGSAPIKTTGSSVSVAAVTAGTNPFANLAVDDVLVVSRATGTTDIRVIVAKADADNVTVDLAVDWSAGFQFRWLDTQTGTSEGDGWINVGNYQSRMITFQLEQISGVTGGIDTRIECRSGGIDTHPTIVWPGASGTAASCGAGTLAGGFCNFTAAGIASRTAVLLNLEEAWRQCRFGMKIGVSETAESVEGDKERITVTFDAVGRAR
jgi:hypothetical protein